MDKSGYDKDKDELLDEEIAKSIGQGGKWRNKKELRNVRKTRELLDDMVLDRKNSCPFPSPDDMIAQDQFDFIDFKTAGFSWSNLWDNEWDLYSMKRHYIEGTTNIRASTSFSPIEAAVGYFMRQNPGTLMSATEQNDTPKVEVIKSSYKHYSSKTKLSFTKNETFLDAAVFGTSISHVSRIKKTRDVELILSDSHDVKAEISNIMRKTDPESRERIKKRLDGGKPLTKRERIIDFDDIKRDRINLYEFYIESNTRVMRGTNYEAQRCIWRTIPSLHQFRAEFDNCDDPFVIKENIKKVKGCQATYDEYTGGTAFFLVPADLSDKPNNIELLRLYDKRNDVYRIVANDVIIREGPLPYNHKQLPFAVHKFFHVNDLFYGLGIPYFLEGVQTETEFLRNINLMQTKINMIPPILRNKLVFEGVESADYLEPGQVYDVNGSVGPENIRWFDGAQPRFDYFKTQESLDQEAVKTIGINALSSALPDPGSAVRNNQMAQESTQKSIEKGVQNWAFGELDAVMMEVKLMQQFYPEIYLKQVDGKVDKKEYKSIKVEGKKLVPVYEEAANEGVKKLISMKVEDSKTSTYFENHADYYSLEGDVDIELDYSSFPIINQSLKVNKIKDFIITMTPFWSNPAILKSAGAIPSILSYVREMDLPDKQDIIEAFGGEGDDDSMERAEEQNEKLLNGEKVPGKEGESLAHIAMHTAIIVDLALQLSDPMMDEEKKQELRDILGNYVKHVALDDSQPTMIAQTAGQIVQTEIAASMPPQPPMMQQPPQGVVDPSMAMGGMTIDPMAQQIPQDAGMVIQQ